MQTEMPRQTLLVLDDTPEIAELVGELGRQAGFAVTVSTDIESFNAALERDIPDVISLDLQMPGTDGVEVLRQLAAMGCEARIILVSGVDKTTVQSAERFGRRMGLRLLGVLSKPFEPEDLMARLSSAKAMTSELTGADLQAAIQGANLVLRYQPVVRRLRAGTWHAESVEALPRWQHKELGTLTPSEFLPLLGSGRSKMMRHFTDFVLQQGVEQLHQWQENGLHLGLRVNVAAMFISDTQFPDRLIRLCEQFDVDPGLLTLELADTSTVLSNQDAGEILTRLRLKGFRLSIDDFGGPGVELRALYSLPACEVKIDPSIVADLTREQGAAVVCGGLIGHARALNIECCAEGVESPEQFAALDTLGCDLAQGYYVGMPMPARQIPAAMQSWTVNTRPRAVS